MKVNATMLRVTANSNTQMASFHALHALEILPCILRATDWTQGDFIDVELFKCTQTILMQKMGTTQECKTFIPTAYINKAQIIDRKQHIFQLHILKGIDANRTLLFVSRKRLIT